MQTLDLIQEYLNAPKTTYAILINGKWGSGKTHYWKNTIRPNLKSESSSLKHTNRRDIYISLYGLESTDEISRKILYELLPDKTKTKIIDAIASATYKVFSSALNFFNLGSFSLTAQDVAKIPTLKDCLLVFDDIERINSSDLIEKVLGYINFLSEHAEMKIIIFTDELKLSAHVENWKVTKEKIISQELNFSPDYDLILGELMNNYKASIHFHDFLTNNKSNMLFCFKQSNTQNLRSLRYALDRFKKLYPALSANKELEKLLSSIFYTIMCVSFEFKIGNLSEANDHGITTISSSIINEREMVRLYRVKTEGSDSTDDAYDQQFFDKYFSNQESQYIITDSLYKYTLTGYWPEKMIEELASKYAQITSTPLEVDELNALQFITSKGINEVEFEKALSNVYSNTENGIFSLLYYPIICKTLEFLRETKLITKHEDEIEQLVERGITKRLSRSDNNYIPFLENHLEDRFFQNASKRIRTKILEHNKQILNDETKNRINDSLMEAKNGNVSPLLELIFPSGPYKEFIPVFNYIDMDEFCDLLFNSQNNFLIEVKNSITARLENKRFTEELKTIAKLSKRILLNLDSQESKLKRFYLKDFAQAMTILAGPETQS